MPVSLLNRHFGRRPRLLFSFSGNCITGHPIPTGITRRNIVVLGIETSCDDTSVSLLEYRGIARSTPLDPPITKLLFHRTVTSNNLPTRGIHPLTSLSSHRTHLAPLVAKALSYLPNGISHPDIVAATRGPGMRASLAAGLDVAKGLAVAWGVPLIGVNHMLGHALTVRLVSALAESGNEAHAGLVKPKFPFWSLLVSGGHTIVVRSQNVMEHSVLCETVDVAVGDMLDKVARCVVPEKYIPRGGDGGAKNGVVYGRLLEEFAFPKLDDMKSFDEYEYDYYPPGTENREQQEKLFREKYPTWSPLPVPFMSTGSKHHVLEFSFSGIGSSVERALRKNPDMDEEERRILARQAMQCAFEHLAKRVRLALQAYRGKQPLQLDENAFPIAQIPPKETLVLSGGVASNSFLRHLLEAYFRHQELEIQLVCPPPRFCTDNAAMIAWAGLEIWEGGVGKNADNESGWATELGCHPVRKWSLDSEEGTREVLRGDPGEGEAKGMMGVDCWVQRGEWDRERKD